MKNIDKTLQYHELLMTRNLSRLGSFDLPKAFRFVFWDNDKCIDDWVRIHIETGEFNCLEEAYQIFHEFYDRFYKEISKRCVFIENSLGEKIATATISPTTERGYNCVVDWFAISPKAQGQKLSKLLLFKALNTAKELGYKKILLHTQTHTWLAAKIYLDCGFVPVDSGDKKGWEILKTITNHPKLSSFNTLDKSELYDNQALKIKKELDKRHKNYNFSIWYINNRNDVYVRENQDYYKYKFTNNGGTIKLIKAE